VGAARLVGDTCQGCRLSLPTMDVARIRSLPPDALAQCENCEAVLVRS
jgi:predicted  nucleic acid-binding Zn-ribbon protein